MTWTQLIDENRVRAEPATKAELDALRSIVARSFADLQTTGLSTDIQFVLAYDAARTLSLMVVRAEGYRPRPVAGHYNTFQALQAADPRFVPQAHYFDVCRSKRNQSEYDFAGGVSDTESGQLRAMVAQFATDVEEWIRTRHPNFVI